MDDIVRIFVDVSCSADSVALMDETARVPTSTPLSDWLSQLAQPGGAPGGGAASAVFLALSAALLGMVTEYTSDDSRAAECAARLVVQRTAALRIAEADGIRSAEFGAALGLPADNAERDDRVRDAALVAARSSALLGSVGRDLVPEVRLLAEIRSAQVKADLAIAAEALATGIAGASINLRANLEVAQTYDANEETLSELQSDLDRLDEFRRSAAAIAAEASADLGG